MNLKVTCPRRKSACPTWTDGTFFEPYAGLSTPHILKYWKLIRKGMKDNVMTLMMSFVKKMPDHHKFMMTQNARKRCCWHCNIWLDWFTSHQSHYFFYLFFLRKLFTFTYYLIYFYQQTADYMQYPNTLNGYNLANSNYQFTS